MGELLSRMLPYIPTPCFIYKFMPCFKTPSESLVWISRVQQTVPEFAFRIQRHYEQPLQVDLKPDQAYSEVYKHVLKQAKNLLANKKNSVVFHQSYFSS